MGHEVDISLSRLSVFKFLEIFHGDGQWVVGCRDLLRRESLAGVRTRMGLELGEKEVEGWGRT